MEVHFWKLWSHTCVFFWNMMLGACRFDQFSSNALHCLQQTNQSYNPRFINNLCQKGLSPISKIMAL
jgi:hypothetical protein